MMDALARARRSAELMYAKDSASQALGIRIDIPSPGVAVATMRVREDMLNGFGMLHGGLLFALADTAFAFACNAYNQVTVAASGNIDFLHPSGPGDELCATAEEDYRDDRRGFYTVRVVNHRSELVAVFRGRSVSRSEALFEPESK